MYYFYQFITRLSRRHLERLLDRREQEGKEDPFRVQEKKSIITRPRPKGPLLWVHAASVGEAQSTLILIERLLKDFPSLHILVTTVTITSARLLAEKLPERAFHQFCPLDHPAWVKGFLDYWRPDMAVWVESELWPNMLHMIRQRGISAVLVNAKLSRRSFKMWRLARPLVRHILGTFSKILAQTQTDRDSFHALGSRNVVVTDNIKYSAKPLSVDADDLKKLQGATLGRPIWVFASTHKGEEEMACRIHQIVRCQLPELLTVIVPRHTTRRGEILKDCQAYGLTLTCRGPEKVLPDDDTDVYVADTMGELGLFYRLAPVSCIGRSFSDDGGGGHNPIEAAQLGSAVLHGPNVQYLQEIFDDMNVAGAARRLTDEVNLASVLLDLLANSGALRELQEKGRSFAEAKSKVIDVVMTELDPLLLQAKIDRKRG